MIMDDLRLMILNVRVFFFFHLTETPGIDQLIDYEGEHNQVSRARYEKGLQVLHGPPTMK